MTTDAQVYDQVEDAWELAEMLADPVGAAALCGPQVGSALLADRRIAAVLAAAATRQAAALEAGRVPAPQTAADLLVGRLLAENAGVDADVGELVGALPAASGIARWAAPLPVVSLPGAY